MKSVTTVDFWNEKLLTTAFGYDNLPLRQLKLMGVWLGCLMTPASDCERAAFLSAQQTFAYVPPPISWLHS